MTTHFELFVARRYLRAQRKESGDLGHHGDLRGREWPPGVMALVIALAINNGFRNTLQSNLLGATAHVNVIPQQDPAERHRELAGCSRRALRKLPHVVGACASVVVQHGLSDGAAAIAKAAVLKGIDVDAGDWQVSESLRHLKAGSLDRLRDPRTAPPGIMLGSRPGGGYRNGAQQPSLRLSAPRAS